MIAWQPGAIRAALKPTTSRTLGLDGHRRGTGGAQVPDGCDSISFVRLCAAASPASKRHEFLYWEFHEGGFKQAALYQGRWKGIRCGSPDAPVVLHDLQNDIAEKRDVAAKHPDIAAKIGNYLAKARSESADWRPVCNQPSESLAAFARLG